MKTKDKIMMAMTIGSMGFAGYMYMKKTPNAMDNMKKMAKDMSKTAYNKLEEMD